jgi:hypothetical protein
MFAQIVKKSHQYVEPECSWPRSQKPAALRFRICCLSDPSHPLCLVYICRAVQPPLTALLLSGLNILLSNLFSQPPPPPGSHYLRASTQIATRADPHAGSVGVGLDMRVIWPRSQYPGWIKWNGRINSELEMVRKQAVMKFRWRGWGKSWTPVRIVSVPAEILNEPLPKNSLKHYRCANPLSSKIWEYLTYVD